MNKRDYVVIAAVLAEEMDANRNEDRGASAVFAIANALADEFEKDNPRFDREKFLAVAEGREVTS